MTLGTSRNSVLAVVVEATEGTPVDPSAAGEYVALQPDATLTPAFDALENDEIRSSIAPSKMIQGIERPEMSFSHYLKHSGTQGTAPEIDELLTAVFGSESLNGTERTCTSGSSVSSFVLAAGGSDFARGKAVLIKHLAFPWEIRPIHSVSSDTLTPGFNSANIPASGTTMGKCVNYSPANASHQSVSMWMYRGNGHLIEMISGGKVVQFSVQGSAGDLINTSFSVVGTKYHFNPIRIAADDTKLDFYDGTDDFAATVVAKVYRDPYELASTIEAAMQTAAASTAYTCTYSSSTGKFTFTKASGTFQLKWNTGANTANTIGNKIGFSIAADDTGALTYTSDNAQTYAAPHTPTYDSADPLAAKNNEILLGDATDTTALEAQSVTITMDNERIEVTSMCAESGMNSVRFKKRDTKVQITALLDKYEADRFRRFRANTDTRFAWNFGTKTGGNWDAGKCGCFYMPTCTISSFTLTDLDGVIGLELELSSFADSSGNGEAYLNFL